MSWIRRFLSIDDLWSAVGYILIVVVARVSNPRTEFLAVSALASGMLAIVWLASPNLRARNLERNPNARVLLWAVVAVASMIGVSR